MFGEADKPDKLKKSYPEESQIHKSDITTLLSQQLITL